MNSYIVVDIVQGTSKVKKTEGRAMLTITLKNEITKKRYITYVVDGHKNVRNWDDVFEGGIGTKLTFNGLERISGNIIDADCVPHVVKPIVDVVTTPDIFSDEPPLTEDELRGFKMFIQHVEAYLANPDLLEVARKAVSEQQ
jgi:hypothetical protein